MAWPHQIGLIPPRARSFQYRSAIERVREAIDGGGSAVLTQVLVGAGGVGKTQLAADYARNALQSGTVDLLIWITASSRPAAVSGFARAAVEILGADATEPEQAARSVLAWLEPKAGTARCRWLIILDDVADPSDLHQLWPPDSPDGRVLITTRRRDAALAGEGRHLVPVGLFTPAEATAYLQAALASHSRQEDDRQLAQLTSDLGHLPLALSQAAAYLIDTRLDCAAYRRLLADQKSRLADLLPEPGSLPDEQSNSVAAAWSLSIDRADRLRPAGLARPMLQLAAMLDPNGIPYTVLTSPPSLAYLTASRQNPEPTGDTVQVEQAVSAMQALHRLSLIEHTPDSPHQAVRVHQLIQRAVREALPADRLDHVARTAADALRSAWPDIERDTVLAQALRANTDVLTRHDRASLWQPGAHRVLFRTGLSLGKSGQVTAAANHFRHLSDAARQYLGPDHPDTLWARHNLANWRGEAGDTAGAVAAHAELLEQAARLLGPDHQSIRSFRHALYRWRGLAGDAAGAAGAFAELLADQERVLGADHPHALAARHELAHWRGAAGDPAGAATAMAELLAKQERVLGPDSLETLKDRLSLAYWQGMAGDTASAAIAVAGVLAERERSLGPEHPDTLFARHHLAFWRWIMEGPAVSVAAYAQLLQDTARVLGPDHPHTLIARQNLATMQRLAKDRRSAVRGRQNPATAQRLTTDKRSAVHEIPPSSGGTLVLATVLVWIAVIAVIAVIIWWPA